MIEIIAAVARWFQLGANLILLGSCIFLAIPEDRKRTYSKAWIDRLESIFPWLTIIVPLGLVVILITTIIQATGNNNNFWHQEIWLGFLSDTRAGQIWLWRAASSILLLLVIVVHLRSRVKARWQYIFCAVIASFPLIASAFVSHAATEEFILSAIIPYALHLIFAGVWFGALPAFLVLIRGYLPNNKNQNSSNLETLNRFSSIALPVMLLIILTGIIVSDRIFDDHYAALFATSYGWLLSAKILLLAVILLIASRIRSYWLPQLGNSHHIQINEPGKQRLQKWVGIEFFLAVILVLLATLITHTTPVKHALIDNWPFPFRFSLAATWNQPNVEVKVWIGLAILILASSVIASRQWLNWEFKRAIGISSILMILGLAITLPPLTIQAYPETYRRSLIPFDVVSVDNGSDLFAQQCVECHGFQGKGNGIKSRTLSTMLPDLLTESHTTDHTPGDFYHWITYGMINTDMPGYAGRLSDEDRWDLVNYIHALSRGYQARILKPEIIPNKAYVKPPVFTYGGHEGNNGALHDFRDKKVVLMVIFSWPQSKERLEQLRSAYIKLSDLDAAVLAIPSQELTAEELAQATFEMPFPIVTQGAAEIVNSYSLFRRTLSHPDLIGKGTIPSHLEFLIDRKGYLRGRWIPSVDYSGWSDIDQLTRQISLLNRETTKILYPEEYLR